MIKTLFLGSNYEALETLKALYESKDFDVIGVITQPDKPIGRKQTIKQTEINSYCSKKGIDVIHTNNKEKIYKDAINKFKPELIICKSFGEIIPKYALEYPKYGAINIHFSLLPKYRGAVPIQKAILNGDKETGISIIIMTEELDSGSILNKKVEKILDTDTNETLRKRLIAIVPDFLLSTLKKWVNGGIKPLEQKNEMASYCWKQDISKLKSKIDIEEQSAEEIDRMVRALLPWPIAWLYINDRKTKVYKTEKIVVQKTKAGSFKTKNNELIIETKENAISIKELQPEGKKRMDIKNFLNGSKVVSIQ